MSNYTIVHNGLHIHLLLDTPTFAPTFSRVVREGIEEFFSRELETNQERRIIYTDERGLEQFNQAIRQYTDPLNTIAPITRDPLAQAIYELDLLSNNEQNV